MIIRTRQGDVELRSAPEWGSSSQIPQPGYQWLASAGVPVTQAGAMGLPAVSSVMRSPSEVLACLPFMSYRTSPRRRAEDSWQWQLLHEQPDDLGSGTFQFFYDVNMSLEGTQNCFIQKAKSRLRIEALYVIDPMRVKVYRDKEGNKLFDVYRSGMEPIKGMTTADIIHIRGFSLAPGATAGTSLLETHRDAIGNSMALQGFEGDYFRNSGTPPFFFTGAKNKEHAQDLIEGHNARHQGVGRQFKVGALWGSTDVKTIPLSMHDAQYVEAKQMSVEEACRIWRWPKELMELTQSAGGRPPMDENAWTARMIKFYMLPRIRRIESAFKADQDLYRASGLVGEFLTAALERADFVTRMQGYKDARQGGWITANEVRDMENMPPHEDGDSILMTPTGSAPNPMGATSQAPNAGGPKSNGSGDAAAAAMAIEQEMWT